MKLNKLVAAFSAAAMLGSLAIAVPASAAENVKIYPSEGLHVRANLTTGFGQYNTLNVTDLTSDATTQYEMQWGSKFAAVYKYDLSPYLNDTDVTITVYTDDAAYSVIPYNKIPENSDDDVATFAEFVGNNIASAQTGEKTLTLTWSDLKTIADANNGKVCLIFTRNNSGKWQKNIDMAKTPYMTINSTPLANPVASIGETKYASFADAFEAAESGDTIKLLDDVELNERYVLDSGTSGNGTYKKNISQLTIDGNDNTVTINAASSFKFLFESNGKQLTFKNMIIDNKREYIINAKAASKITLDGVTAAAPILNSAANDNLQNGWVNATDLNVTNAADGVSIYTSASSLPGSVEVALTEALAANYDVVNGVLTAKAVAPTTTDEYFSFEGEDGISYNTVEVTATNGTSSDKKSADLGTTITGGSLFLEITGVPADVTIEKVTLK